MDLELTGKQALVTGASSGIGAAITRTLAEEGCDVVAVARTREALEALKKEVEGATGRRVDVAIMDISERGAVRSLSEAFPEVDILVNNAGEDPTGRLTEIDEERWRQAWDLKVFGYLGLCREYYPLMQKRGGGVMINIIGVAHLIRDARYICGATSTAAITALTQALGGSSMHDGIRVVGVGPGVTATPRVMKGKKLADEYAAKAGGSSPDGGTDLIEISDRIAKGLGLARGGRAEEIASLVAYVASPRAAYMSGTIAYSDGGWART